MVIPLSGKAQDIRHSCRSTVRVGEQFQVSFEIDGDCKNFKGPNFDGFNILGGPMSSTNSSIQIVNGKMTRNSTTTYSYILRAIKEGKFTIDEATAKSGNKKIMSEPFTIEVTVGNTPSSDNKNTTEKNNEDVFLKATVSKTEVHVGEQIMLNYRIYTKVPIASMTISQKPSYGGFWTKTINENSGSLQRSTEIINGEEYMVAEVQYVALIPQRPGQLTIDPIEIECLVQVRRERTRSNDPFDIFFNDPFFNSSVSTINKNVKTEPIKISVKSLPTANRPLSFGNAVGQFSIKSNIDKTELKSNEAFTLTLSVSGRGNLDLLEMPKPTFPPDFEVYEPKISIDTKATNRNGIQGTKKAEYLVIPRTNGDFTIPPTEFSYFDPSKKAYATLNVPEYSIKVTKDDARSGGSDLVMPMNQTEIKYIGQDITHIRTGSPRLRKQNTAFLASTAYWCLLAMVVVVFAIALIIISNNERLSNNESLARNRKANKVASGKLKKAHAAMLKRDQDTFYNEMSQALWGYISDKLTIERSKLSIDTVSSMLTQNNIPAELVEEFVDTLNNCEFARFAPGDAGKKMDDLYNKGLAVITKTEKQL